MCQEDYQIPALSYVTAKLHFLFINYLIGYTLCSCKTRQNFMFILWKIRQPEKEKLQKSMFTPCSLIIENDYLTNKELWQ